MIDPSANLLMRSREYFCPLAPRPEDFAWVDVASGLISQGRFQGQLPAVPVGQVYLVAQHAIEAVNLLRRMDSEASPMLQRAVFHHDDVEGLWGFGDVCGPVKRLPMVEAVLRPIEQACEAVIALRIGVPADFATWEPVKRIDDIMFLWEDRDLRGGPDRGCLPREQLTCWPPDLAYARWISEHVRLQDAAIAAQQRQVEELVTRFESYAGGDRAPSPPASLIRELGAQEKVLSLLRMR